jgi:hypothetical protein
MYQISHSPYLADQLSNAYDCYLAILRETDRRISIELGREDRKWAIKNVCAPCLYKTEDEPKLKFEFLAAMDGNNSLKLVDSTYRAGTVRTDSRQTESPRWIKPEEVDLFKDEIGKVKSYLACLTLPLMFILTRAIHEAYVRECQPPWSIQKSLQLKKRRGSTLRNTTTLPSAWTPALTDGEMQDLKHARRCSPCSPLRASSWRFVDMAMF